MNGLIFLPDRNTKRDKKTGKLKPDYTGAFLPEAIAFSKHHSIESSNIVEVDVSLRRRDMRNFICDKIKEHESPLDVVAFFCHGLKNSIQLGFSVHNLSMLIDAMESRVMPDVVIALFCCSAARDLDSEIQDDKSVNVISGDGGFADTFRDLLCKKTNAIDCRVVAHVTAGHTTINPWVKYFDGNGSKTGGYGGKWLVEPKSRLWKKWIRVLKNKNSLLRYRYLFYSIARVRMELEGKK